MEGNFLSRYNNKISEFESLSRASKSVSERRRVQQDMAMYIIQCLPFMEKYTEETTEETNTDNIFNVKETVGLARGDIYTDYLVEVEGVQVDRPRLATRVREHCSSCGVLCSNIVHLHETSDMVCDGCGQVVGTIISDELTYREEQESSTKIINYSYKRQNHFNEWLSQFQGAEMCNIPDDVIVTLREELKKQKLTKREDITHTRVRTLLKKLKMQKFYEHVPLLCCLLNGVRPPQMSQMLEQKLRLMFNQIQEPFDKVCPPGRKNFLSYSYTLYKLCELLGEDTYLPYFPLLKSKEKLHAMDMIWLKICDELRWEYIPTI